MLPQPSTTQSMFGQMPQLSQPQPVVQAAPSTQPTATPMQQPSPLQTLMTQPSNSDSHLQSAGKAAMAAGM